jgi:prolipoprotein diacylglyceryltransferase
MIIGRGGCFSTGIHEATYGIASSLPWAMDLGDGMRRHPVVLYEMAFLMLLWAGLIKLRHAADLSPGSLFRIFLIAYLLFRFFLDFIKPGWRPLPGITTIQLACLGGLLYYAPYLVNPSRLTATKTPHAS